jgi:hypothetical protein
MSRVDLKSFIDYYKNFLYNIIVIKKKKYKKEKVIEYGYNEKSKRTL